MLIVSQNAIHGLMTAITSATHALVDQDGQRVVLGTIDAQALRMAALNALCAAAAQTVWPADQPIDYPKPVARAGPFRS